MDCRRLHPILPLLALALMVVALVCSPAPAAAARPGIGRATPAAAQPAWMGPPPSAAGPLERRLANWPAWSLPAPLPRPDRGDLIWPAWFQGEWEVSSTPAEGSEPPLRWRARFQTDGEGGAFADRAFNAGEIGKVLLGLSLIHISEPTRPY